MGKALNVLVVGIAVGFALVGMLTCIAALIAESDPVYKAIVSAIFGVGVFFGGGAQFIMEIKRK